MTVRRVLAGALVAALGGTLWQGVPVEGASAAGAAAVQTTPAPAQNAPVVTSAQLSAAIDQLGAFDLSTRTKAAATVRRAFVDVAVPALTTAALAHKDEYVRYRALVLLAGFGANTVPDTMNGLIADRDDRLRTVVYEWLERHPDPARVPTLVAALDREASEFVRPALLHALAAVPSDDRTRAAMLPQVTRGVDFFRGAAIAALGQYKASYAGEAIAAVAKLDGPLQEDAITALGEIGDRSHLNVLSALQHDAPAERQPTIAAAVCLMGLDCEQQQSYLTKTLAFAATQDDQAALLGAAAHGLGVLGAHGRVDALAALIATGVPAQDPARGAVGLALANAAVRNPDALLNALVSMSDPKPAILLLRDGFDMLSAEDFAQEQFFVAVRQAYWAAPDGSPRRRVAQALIDTLEF